MTKNELANAVNARLAETKSALAKLDDETALDVTVLFPEWAVGKSYTLDERIRYGENLYKCVQAHTSQEGWNPAVTPALWAEVAKPGEIPVWKQPTGVQDAYNTGDRVWWPAKDDHVYESLIDANVYSPEAYPAGWKLLY